MARPTTGAEIREAFLAFFESRGHRRMPSDSLVPANDPTLLFTGAGMNQFKDEFRGRGRAGLKRAVTSQKCLRVPDLENVGLTPRHHTFFEMLGNFSFGDYFKAETIPWEWEFFTEVLGWDPDRLLATVYTDDDEAFGIWRETGLPRARIYRFGEKENFWPASAPSQGPNGPCGPCSEIYFDQHPDDGELPAPAALEALPERFLEVGNFVFTQFDRQDGGRLEPLPQKNIDVGLGLERIAAVAQGAANNFETDLFAPLLDALQSLTGRRYGSDAGDDVRMRRIADHSRAVFFCIADGAAPGRDGRGYVVRKILRRAVRDGIELGLEDPFLAGLLPAVRTVMGAAYPELGEQATAIQSMVQAEEERFQDVYRHGIARLEAAVAELRPERGATLFPGRIAFELHDTYGFPADITEVVVREHGLELDQAGFQEAMEEQRQRARAGSGLRGEVFSESPGAGLRAAGHPPTAFLGYEEDSAEAEVLALLRDDAPAPALAAGEAGVVVLDRSPFYAESGGQEGDRGVLCGPSGAVLFEVEDTRAEEGYRLHRGKARALLEPGMRLTARVDAGLRRRTEGHHTATHLLHAALKQVLGETVHQAGSLVAPERLRFDYTHPEKPAPEQLASIEDLVNTEVLKAQAVSKRVTSLAEARAEGVVALFGEKYGDEVRVVEVAGFSKELCGGTHVRNTGAIGPFLILSDRALAAGVRRIEALAGAPALEALRRQRTLLGELERTLKVPAARLPERVAALREELKTVRQHKASAAPAAGSVARELAAAASRAGSGPSFAWKRFEGLDGAALRNLADQVAREDGLPDVVLLLGTEPGGLAFVVLCRKEAGVRAGDLARRFGALVGGGGGGRPDFAQGRGTRTTDLEDAAEQLRAGLGAHA